MMVFGKLQEKRRNSSIIITNKNKLISTPFNSVGISITHLAEQLDQPAAFKYKTQSNSYFFFFLGE